MVVIKYGDHEALLTACGCAVIFIWLVALFIVALFIATLFMMPSTPTSEQSATTMRQPQNFLRKNKLIVFLSVVLIFGFLATSLISFNASRSSIRQSIIQNELPLTTDNIYSEIQKDLIRPVFISSMMASDTFLRD
jgi:Ni,Fe-hydrogenase I cytochrome b subunit